jgi:HD-GYP domain-containing protein (c-di-GMP phosphodiesterase class II)
VNQSRQLKPEHAQVLLGVAKAMMQERSLPRLLKLITADTTRVMGADRSSLFLADEDRNEIYTLIAEGIDFKEIRIGMDRGLAGYVARAGETINIRDAYQDERFDREVDKRTGYHTKTVLCMPLFSPRTGQTLGVVQVLNKLDGYFTDYDENLLAAFASQAAVAIENAQFFDELQKQFTSFVATLAASIDARSPFTAGHSERVTKYALRLGRALGLEPEQMELLNYAAMMHDLGKIGVRDAVLNKPSRLTPEEYDEIKAHPQRTFELLSKMRFARALRDIPRLASSHHERLDGSGYPRGLSNDDIPLIPRILAVVDVYEALTAADRPYRKAMSPAEAIQILEKEKADALDPLVVDTFIKNKLFLS